MFNMCKGCFVFTEFGLIGRLFSQKVRLLNKLLHLGEQLQVDRFLVDNVHEWLLRICDFMCLLNYEIYKYGNILCLSLSE